MSPQPPDPLASKRPPAGAEPAAEILEFVGDEPLGRPARLVPPDRRRRTLRRRTRLSVILFALTCLSVFAAGLHPGAIGGVLHGVGTARAYPIWALTGDWGAIVLLAEILRFGGIPPGLDIGAILLDGAVYGGCLMAILLAHEMGHFLQAVRNRVPATFPFFIPFPISPFGTMGAVIVQDGTRANRRQLFDIAVSGPLAGLLIALPVAWHGVSTSRLATFEPSRDGVHYGDPLLLRWMVEAIHGPYGPNQDILINAPLFAGWVGIFITALNLLPVGQLDGGHILYTLVGRKAHWVAYAVLTAAIGWMVFGWIAYRQPPSYVLMVALLFLFGAKHPPTANDAVPLGPVRIVLGWLTLAFVVIGFTPTPIV